MQTNMHEAKTQLSKLIQKALAGEDVVIAKDGKPVAKLMPLKDARTPRRLGGWKGTFRMAEDFDAELPEFDDYSPQ